MKTKLPSLILATVTGCLLGLSQTQGVTVSLSNSAPTENVIRYQDVTTGTPSNITSYWRQPGGSDQKKDMGQGFSMLDAAGDFQLTAVTFNIYSVSTQVLGLSFKISIYETSAIGTVPSEANLISEQTGTLPAAMSANDYITFTLDTPVHLQAGKYYNVVYSFAEMTDPVGSQAYSLSFKTIGSGITNSVNGRRWIIIDGAASASNSNGFVFYAIGAPIPETSASALTLVGTFGMLFVLFGKMPKPRRV